MADGNISWKFLEKYCFTGFLKFKTIVFLLYLVNSQAAQLFEAIGRSNLLNFLFFDRFRHGDS